MTTKRKRYELTPEHKARFAEWRDLWISRAMSTRAMDGDDRARMVTAIRGLYEAAGLKPPPDHRIVFVPSPFVGAFASGFAAGVWHLRKSRSAATWAATGDATGAATEAATGDATWAATEDATRAATGAATGDATEAATRAATGDATRAATRDATEAATRDATKDATEAATGADLSRWFVMNGNPAECASAFGPVAFLLGCASLSWRLMNGGNQWAGYPAYLSFFRHVAGIESYGVDYSRWQHYEDAAIFGGPRWMHEEFCIVSDRPEVLLVDDQNRPHCATGPFCRWRDGSALYAVHGTRLPAWIIERRDTITPAAIDAETNAEVRRVMVELYGLERYMRDGGATVVDESGAGLDRRKLWRKEQRNDEPLVMVELINSTPEPDGSRKTYLLRVPPDTRTAKAAVAWTFGLSADEYAPGLET